MGILNLTEDSYFIPSRYNMSVLESGADIIDIGAVSTRPGAAEVPEEEEWARLEPVLRLIDASVSISIDTVRSSIVERAADILGRTFIVNDISSGEDDSAMLETVSRLGLGYIAMHKRGTPSTMQSLCDYDDVVSDVLDYFSRFAAKAEAAGVKDWIIDPGFGFAKTVEQNYRMLDSLAKFSGTGRRVLVGISRKSFIYKPLGIGPEDALPATQALHMAALERGADILRVHDVAAARETVRLYRMLSLFDAPEGIV
ncbi:MAG: dihydropteroate synthase [Bacteroidia bacterium]|nr:dihydropteroate synthase [Bacteroidia bacterium]